MAGCARRRVAPREAPDRPLVLSDERFRVPPEADMSEQRPPSDHGNDHEDEDAFEAPERGSADELLDAGAKSDLDAMRHSAAHVMAEAVMELFPGTQLGIGPAIADGFYYDFLLPRQLTPD